MDWIPAILILPYCILLLQIYKGLLKIRPYYNSTDPAILVSVIIACRDEEKNLPGLLADISKQNYPDNQLEVIVVNDRSTDRTYQTASEFYGIKNLLILNNTGTGKKQAIRTGILAAKGNLILTTDADCRMGINWVRTIAGFYELNNPDMVIAPVKLDSAGRIFGNFQELEFLGLQGVTAGSAIIGEPAMCNGANLAFNREKYLLHSNNLHDEINSGDDVFLLHSLKENKKSKILWIESPEAIVSTNSSSTLRTFIMQRSRWISKAEAYKDRYTIVLGVVTFIAVVLNISFLIASLFYPPAILVFLTLAVLKAIPDFLILSNTAQRYEKSKLMRWFIPAQLIYPLYVLSVFVYALKPADNKKINYPFQKET